MKPNLTLEEFFKYPDYLSVTLEPNHGQLILIH